MVEVNCAAIPEELIESELYPSGRTVTYASVVMISGLAALRRHHGNVSSVGEPLWVELAMRNGAISETDEKSSK